VLLFGAGLLLRALQSAEALDLGFTPAGVVYAEYDVRTAGYSAQRAAAFNAALAATARQLPGVAAVGMTSHVPLHGGVRRINVRLGGHDTQAVVSVSTVTHEYFDIVRVAFVDGRNFSADERAGSAPAVIISEGLARRFFPGRTALGQTLTSAKWPAPRPVVGVVRDASTTAIWRDKEMAIYTPAQAAEDAADVRLILRTNGDEAVAARALAVRAAQLDPDLRFQANPVSGLLRLWMLPSRVAAASAGVLAALALALASIGLYGVLTFSVGQRLRELGIRMALGADPRAVVELVLRDGWTLVWRGLAIGGGGALLAAPLLGRMLFGVRPFDPITMAGVALVLGAVALAASYVPARRASRLEPVAILRME
jgi:predicted permease